MESDTEQKRCLQNIPSVWTVLNGAVLSLELMIAITKVLENVYVLKDRAGCCANLVVGKEKALLFDTRLNTSQTPDSEFALRFRTEFLLINDSESSGTSPGLRQNNKINLTKRRWLVLLASCLINLCIGALYAWSVFAAPMAAHLSEILGKELTAADLSVVFSVGNGLGFITMIGGGFLNQKIGPRWVIFAGGILFGAGFVICGFASDIPMLVTGYGLFSGLAMGLAYGCTISNSVKFFPDKAGLVGGIATASYGISSVLVPPVANALIDRVGVSRAFVLYIN